MNMNEIAPPRSSKFLGQPSRVIHNSRRYVASVMRQGLIVQSNLYGNGKLLPVSHQQYADYVSAIETALDAKEADHLCAALIR
jgi:hypothetical protein